MATPSNPKSPYEIGVLWRKVNIKTNKALWSGRINIPKDSPDGLDIVAFTFKTKGGREGMSIQRARTFPAE